jgi:hypothetical protein
MVVITLLAVGSQKRNYYIFNLNCMSALNETVQGEQRRNRNSLERETGIEPATTGSGSRHSTAELLPHDNLYYLMFKEILECVK